MSRSGNVWGVDEAQLAADLARKVQVSAQAEAQAQERATSGRHQAPLFNSGASAVPSSSSAVPAPGPGGSKELSLKGVGLVQVPAEVWQAASWLSKLDLSGNRNLDGDFQQVSV